MGFEKLGLTSMIQKAIEELGYQKPTPVQAKVIPAVLEGRDVMATAQTGTGKTAAYALPLLEILTQKKKAIVPKSTRSLILVPTRELASQVGQSIQQYGQYVALSVTMIYGGVKFTPQTKKLERSEERRVGKEC